MVFENFGIDIRHHPEAFRKLIAFIAIDCADIEGGIKSQPINVKLIQPHQHIIPDKLPDFGVSVIRSGRAPGGNSPLVVVKIDAPIFTFMPAVKTPKVQVSGSKMVINHILYYRKPGFMGFFYKMFVGIGTAISAFDCENVSWIVSPGIITREFSNWHYLDYINA